MFNYDQTDGRITFGVVGIGTVYTNNYLNNGYAVNGQVARAFAFSTDKNGDGRLWVTFYNANGEQLDQQEVPTDGSALTEGGFDFTVSNGVINYKRIASRDDLENLNQLFSWNGVLSPWNLGFTSDKFAIPEKVTMKNNYYDESGNLLGTVYVTGLAGQTFTAPAAGTYKDPETGKALTSKVITLPGYTVSGNTITGKISDYSRDNIKTDKSSGTVYTPVRGLASDYYNSASPVTSGYVDDRNVDLKSESEREAIENDTNLPYEGTVKITKDDVTIYVDYNDTRYHRIEEYQYERNVFSGGSPAVEYVFEDKDGSVVVTYFDTTSNKTLATNPLSGQEGDSKDTGITTTVDNYKSQGYDLVDVIQDGTELTSYDTTTLKAGENTPIVVNLKHKTTTVTPDNPKDTNTPLPDNPSKNYPSGVNKDDLNKTITRTINVHYPDGTTKTTTQTATLTRTATVDEVDGSVTYTNWTTGSWDAFTTPTVDGYTPSQSSVAETTVTSDMTDQTVDITYTATPKQDGSVTIKYVDGDNNDQEISHETLNGKQGDTPATNITDTVKKLEQQGYEFNASTGVTQDGKTLTDYDTTTLPAGTAKDIVVTLTHKTTTVTPDPSKPGSNIPTPGTKLPDNPGKTYPDGVTEANLTKTITRTINVHNPLTGKTEPTKQVVTLTRTATIDEVTGEATYGKWSTGNWDEFTTPTINGYTPSQSSVAKTPVTSETKDQTVDITYTANPAKTGTVQITYTDKDGKDLSSYNTSKDGDAGKTVETGITTTLGDLEKKGYELVSVEQGNTDLTNNHDTVTLTEGNNTPVEVTVQHKIVEVKPNDPKNPGDNIPGTDQKFPGGVTESDLNKTVTRTVTVNTPDGKSTTKDYPVTLTRTAKVDAVTGEVKYGDWTTSNWNAYDVTDIPGYTPAITLKTTDDNGQTRETNGVKDIPAETVTSTTPNEAYTVTYQAVEKTVNVHFVDENGKPLLDPYAVTGTVDEPANSGIAGNAAKLNGYTLSKVTKGSQNGEELTSYNTISFSSDDSKNQDIYVTMTKNTPAVEDHTVTITYVDKDDNPVGDKVTTTVPDGTTVDTETKINQNVPEGYTVVTGQDLPKTVTVNEDSNINVTVEKANDGDNTPTTPTKEDHTITITYVDKDGNPVGDKVSTTVPDGTTVDTETKINDNVPEGYTVVTGQDLPKTVTVNEDSNINVTVEKTNDGDNTPTTPTKEDHTITITYVDKDGNPVGDKVSTTVPDGTTVDTETKINDNVPEGYTVVTGQDLPKTVTVNEDSNINVTVEKTNDGDNTPTTPTKEDHTITITYVHKDGNPVGDKVSTKVPDGTTVDTETKINQNVPDGYTVVTGQDLPKTVTVNEDKTIKVTVEKNTPAEEHTVTITYVDKNGNPVGEKVTTKVPAGSTVDTNTEINNNVPDGYTVVPNQDLPGTITVNEDHNITVTVEKDNTPEDHTVTITYVDKNGNPVGNPVSETVTDGTTVDTETKINNNVPDGYTVVTGQDLPKTVTVNEDKTITVTVEKANTPVEDHTVTITYVDKDGNQVGEKVTTKVPDGYTVDTNTEINNNVPNGYTIVTGQDLPGTITVTEDHNITVTVEKTEKSTTNKDEKGDSKSGSGNLSKDNNGDDNTNGPANPAATGNPAASANNAANSAANDQAAAKRLPQTGSENPAAATALGLAGLLGGFAALGAKRKKRN